MPPSINYMNRSAPFWDWVASLEQEGPNHPFFAQNQDESNSRDQGHHEGPRGTPFAPWAWGFPGFEGRGFPFRGPPGPAHHDAGEEHEEEKNDEKDAEMMFDAEGKETAAEEKGKSREVDNEKDNGAGPCGSGSDNEGNRCQGRSRHGPCGPRRGRSGCGGGGGFGPRHHGGPHHGGPHHGPPHLGGGPHGPWGRRGGWGGGRGGWGAWARGGPFGGTSDRDMFSNPLAGLVNLFDFEGNKPSTDNASEDFTPETDIFDTPDAYILHLSLPGAKKEDVGVNWDAERSELSIAGVAYRPGNEELLKTLAVNERKVGPFEKKVRLGTRASPANVDVDGITAKLEDGILRVEVPKLGENGFVEVKKVDVE